MVTNFSLFQWLTVTIALLTTLTQATHVYIELGQPKCFYEDLSQDMILNGQLLAEYGSKATGYVEDSDVQLTTSIKEAFDGNHQVFLQKNVNGGEFTFTALESGEHAICITANKLEETVASNNVRLHIEFNRGLFSAVDGSKKSTINSLKTRVNHYINKLNNIKAEQRVVMDREAIFRALSERANSQITWWSIFQVLFFCVTCFFQLKYMRNFFVKQKIA